MLLSNLKHPYQKKSVISIKDNNAVIQQIPLQHIGDNLYQTRGRIPRLYAYYDDYNIGIYVTHLYYYDRLTVDGVLQKENYQHVKNVDSFRAMTEMRIASDGFINCAEIMLLGYIAPELVPAATQARIDFMEKGELERQRRHEEFEAKEKAITMKMNKLAARELVAALRTMRSSGSVKQSEIAVYLDAYHAIRRPTFILLADIYEVAIPISVRGWISKWLYEIIVENGEIAKSGRDRAHRSKTYMIYLHRLINAVAADTNNDVLTAWLASKSIIIEDPAETVA